MSLGYFYASHQQQKMNNLKVSVLITQADAIFTLQKYGPATTYFPICKGSQLLLVAFANTSHSDLATQLCYIVGIVLGPIRNRFIFICSPGRPTGPTVLVVQQQTMKFQLQKKLLKKLHNVVSPDFVWTETFADCSG